MFRHFHQSGILGDLLRDALLYHDPHKRDIVADMKEIFGGLKLNYTGLENIPVRGGGLLVFNHPDVQVIAPAVFSLPAVFERAIGRRDIAVMMGAELPIWGHVYFPGSPWLINRIAGTYPDHFLLVPTSKLRLGYESGRTHARHEAVKRVLDSHLLAFAPEGQIEKDGVILPVEKYRHRAGNIGQAVTLLRGPVIPMGIWQDEAEVIQVSIGPEFAVDRHGRDGSIEMMAHIAAQLPGHLRGPFR